MNKFGAITLKNKIESLFENIRNVITNSSHRIIKIIYMKFLVTIVLISGFFIAHIVSKPQFASEVEWNGQKVKGFNYINETATVTIVDGKIKAKKNLMSKLLSFVDEAPKIYGRSCVGTRWFWDNVPNLNGIFLNRRKNMTKI